MTRRDHYKTNLRLAWPVMVGQLGQVMVSVADSIMVGRLGTIQLAAVALANSIFHIFMVFAIGVSFAITPLTAQAEGRGQKHLQGVLLRHAFRLNLGLGAVVMVIIWFAAPNLGILGQEPDVVSTARGYLLIIGSSIIPLLGFATFKQFAEGLSDTRRAMVVIVFCNLLNIALNYALIFGKFGLPEMGMEGAGWSTLIARLLMMFMMWHYLFRNPKFAKYKLRLAPMNFRPKVIRRLLQIGVPSGLQFLFEVSAFSLAAIFAGMISATALAAHQISINIASVSYMAVTGLGAAATVRVGNQIGRRDPRSLHLASSTIFQLAVFWMGLAGLGIFLFRDTLAGFYSVDPEVLELANHMLIVVVFFQLSDGVQAVALGALRGFTDVRIPTFITFVVYWLLTLPAAYFLSQHTALGAMGIWYALAGGLTLSALMLVFRFRNLRVKFSESSGKIRR